MIPTTRLAISAAAAALLLGPAAGAAQNSAGAFVIRLGRDTSGIETFTRRGNRIEGDVVQRYPRTTLRHFVIELTPEGGLARAEITSLRPESPSAPPLARSLFTWANDTVTIEQRRDSAVQRRRVRVPGQVTPLNGAESGVTFELLTTRFHHLRADSADVPIYFLGLGSGGTAQIRRTGTDSVEFYDGYTRFRARWNGSGRLHGVVPLGGTHLVTIERIRRADARVLAAAFAARDAQGRGLGALSTRDTVQATVAGANIWVDYGRPAKRGRAVFGSSVVLWGEVWRTGANAATQFRTDRDLEAQGVVIPAGTYTLWTIPYANGTWKLLFNRQAGQWGTEHDPARDVAQLDLRVTTLPAVVERFTIGVAAEAAGGTLMLDWDTTRAALTFTVR